MGRHIWIVFYSDSGNTRRVAEELVEALGGELVMLRAPGLGSGIVGAFRRVRDSLLRRPARIEPAQVEVGPDDLVVIGSPVWAARLASPVRAWLLEHGPAVTRHADFVTLGASGSERALAEIPTLVGRAPEATLVISDRDRTSGDAARKIEEFAGRLREVVAGSGSGSPSERADDVVAFPRRS